MPEELPNTSSQILGSVIFMDNHHLKLILHRTISVVWLTNDDHLLVAKGGVAKACVVMLMLMNEFVMKARSYLTGSFL